MNKHKLILVLAIEPILRSPVEVAEYSNSKYNPDQGARNATYVPELLLYVVEDPPAKNT